jgi:glutaredoxin
MWFLLQRLLRSRYGQQSLGAAPAPITGKTDARKPAEIVLYTRQGCHLCEDARAVLDSAALSYPLVVKSVDVDTDPDLVSSYGLEVPVVMINGKVRFRGRINGVLLDRLLQQGS